MKESISSRVRRIITGTASTIVARIEGLAPEMILAQAVDEIDGAIDEVRAELGTVTAQQHQVRKAIAKLNAEHAKLEGQVDTAMGGGRKDLVEAAVARQVDIEDQLPALEHQIAELAAQEAELNQAVTGLLSKRHEMDEQLFEFKRQRNQAGLSGEPDGAPKGSALGKADRAGKAFDRVLQDATGVRTADFRTSLEDRAKLVELSQLSRKAKIEARLKALEGR